ncbi:MAG: ATP-binding protein [Peptococcaceae bacterium]|nr:ATP-binding protein [Peptococcaceae bacterium]MDH7526024.1 ATP-binding protein [Peptococcaceae bacterium]
MEYRRSQQNITRLFESAQIPRRYLEKTFAAFEQELQPVAWKTACRYVERFSTIRNGFKNSLWFTGTKGTGKSHLAYAITNELLKQQYTVITVVVPDLLDMLRPKADKTKTLAEERMQAIRTADLVILDDLGAEKDSEWAAERIYLILNNRYNEQKPVVVTSNPLPDELEKISQQWERIVSRLHEMCYIITMDGPDYRKGGMPNG